MRGIIKKDLYLERKNIFLCLGVYLFMVIIAIVAVLLKKDDFKEITNIIDDIGII